MKRVRVTRSRVKNIPPLSSPGLIKTLDNFTPKRHNSYRRPLRTLGPLREKIGSRKARQDRRATAERKQNALCRFLYSNNVVRMRSVLQNPSFRPQTASIAPQTDTKFTFFAKTVEQAEKVAVNGCENKSYLFQPGVEQTWNNLEQDGTRIVFHRLFHRFYWRIGL